MWPDPAVPDGLPAADDPDGLPAGFTAAGVPGPADPPWPAADPGVPAASILARFDPGRRGVRALAAVAVVVVLVAGYLAWRAQPRAEPVPPPTVPVSGPGTAAPATILVAVSGRVARPGVVRLPAGARVQDAIEAAGGALPGTDLSFVNLARPLRDGELILVGVSPPPGVPQAAAGGDGGGVPGKINLNTATPAELDTLPGIGPELATRIVAYRAEHGGFRSVDELRQVSGIGESRYAEIKDLVTV